MVKLIQEAMVSGARLVAACEEASISLRTYRRWYREGTVQSDQRLEAVHVVTVPSPNSSRKISP